MTCLHLNAGFHMEEAELSENEATQNFKMIKHQGFHFSWKRLHLIYLFSTYIFIYIYTYICRIIPILFCHFFFGGESKTSSLALKNNAKVNTPSLRELPSYGDRLRKVDANSAAFWRKGLVGRWVVFDGVWYRMVGWKCVFKDQEPGNYNQPTQRNQPTILSTMV